jgi:hypothetical protein
MHLLRTTSVTSAGPELAKELAAWSSSCPALADFLKSGSVRATPCDIGFRSAFRFTTVVDVNRLGAVFKTRVATDKNGRTR